MPIQKIYKGNDLLLEINLVDENGNTLRIKDTKEFYITLYTENECEAFGVNCSFKDGIFKRITEKDNKDYLIIESSSLDYLKEGIVLFNYFLSVENSLFPSGYYSESRNGQTNYYLKSKNYYDGVSIEINSTTIC